MRDARCIAIPSWNPVAVRWIARVWPLTPEMVNRLVTEPEMKYVWNELRRREYVGDDKIETEKTRLSQVKSNYRLSHWNVQKRRLSLHDEIIGCFFAAALDELRNTFYSSSTTVSEQASPWLMAAQTCQVALDSHPFGPLMMHDADLKRSLAVAADHLQWVGESIAQNGNPRVAEKDRGNLLYRGQVRAIAVHAKRMFGSPMPRTVSRIVSVAHGMRDPINPKDAENWCATLPN